jgi:hypothetical protein
LTIPDVVPIEEDEEAGEPKKKKASGRSRAAKRRPKRAADDFERFDRVRSLRDLDPDYEVRVGPGHEEPEEPEEIDEPGGNEDEPIL